MPEWIEPMAAMLTQDRFSGPEWLFERKADRGGRILVDTGRNGFSATFAAPYAVRARPGAPVSAPCTWSEVECGDVAPQTFTLRTMGARTAAVGDVWADLLGDRQSLGEAAGRLVRLAPSRSP